MEMVKKASEETDAQVTKLSDDIEPPSLSNDIDFAMASRKDLEVLGADAKVAEDNVTAFMPRYVTLLKAERDKVESARLVTLTKMTSVVKEPKNKTATKRVACALFLGAEDETDEIHRRL
jgi:hypothetical protein